MEYEGKLRVVGMDIFNQSTYVAIVSFYESEKLRDEHCACGALIQYILKATAENFFKTLGFKNIDEDDQDKMFECSSKVCKMLAEKIRTEFSSFGYSSLSVSEPETYLNSVPFGVDFNPNQFEKIEVVFEIKKEKIFAVDLTMAMKSK
jgi:hypothetical protein